MRALLSGDSHCNVYAEGARGRAGEVAFDIRMMGPANLFGRVFHEPVDGALLLQRHVFYLEELHRRLPHVPLAGDDGPFHWYGFSGPLHLHGLWLGGDLFAGRRLVASSAVLRQVVLARRGAWLKFLTAARKLGLPVFVLEAPRLFEASPLVARMREHADDDELLAADARARDIVRTALAELGVVCVDVPPEAVEPAGWMSPALRAADVDDPHHGNAELGRLMLDRAEAQLLALPQPDPAPVPEGIAPVADARLDGPPPGAVPVGPSEPLPAELAGRRVRVVVGARSSERDRYARFAVRLRAADWDSGPRWLWAEASTTWQWCDVEVPAGAPPTIRVEPNDGAAEATAEPVVEAILVDASTLG